MDYICTIIDASTTNCVATGTPAIISSTYTGINYHDFLFVACVFLFFFSYQSWGYLTYMYKKIYDN